MQKSTAWMIILVSFVIGIGIGYAWHYQQTGRTVPKVCQTDKDGIETCIYYNYERREK